MGDVLRTFLNFFSLKLGGHNNWMHIIKIKISTYKLNNNIIFLTLPVVYIQMYGEF